MATAPDPMADRLDVRRVVFDMVDLLSHEVLFDPNHRNERTQQLNYFLERLGDTGYFGRLYTRVATAAAVEKFCSRDAYWRKDPPEPTAGQPRQEKFGHTKPLVEWTVKEWEKQIADLKELKGVYLRMDANTLIIPSKLKEFPSGNDDSDDSDNDLSMLEKLENSSIDEELASSELFQKNYDAIIINLRFHQALSPFRAELERELDQAEEVNIEVPGIQPNDIVEFDKFLSSHFESVNSSRARELLETLLVRGGKSHNTRSNSLSLKSISDLKEIFSRKEFSLHRLQRKVEKLLLKWSEAVLDRPTLAELGYGRSVLPPLDSGTLPAGDEEREDGEKIPENEEEQPSQSPKNIGEKRRRSTEEVEEAGDISDGSQEHKSKAKRSRKDKENDAPVKIPEEVQELTRARKTLREDVHDPLEESREIAATAARASTAAPQRSPHGAKQNARPLGRQGADWYKKKPSAERVVFTDSEDESDEGATTLSAVPNRPNIREAPQEEPRIAERVQLISASPRKRKRFTDEEKSAIKLGVERFGFGRWAKIKEYYKEELRERTSMNIKDCYRTMMRKNEV